MDEEKKKPENHGGQSPQKEIGELMSPVESIADEIIATKEGAIFLKVLYRQASQKVVELQVEMRKYSAENVQLAKDKLLLESALRTKHFLDFITSVLIAVAVILVDKAIEGRDWFLGGSAIALIVVSFAMMWRYIGPARKGKSQGEVE